MTILDLVASLRLDTGEYEQGLDEAEKEANGFGSKLKSGLGTAAKVGGVLLTAASGAAIAFGKSSVQAGMQFDAAMARVAATSGKSVDELGDLRDFALEMGRTTAFSATEAAQALNYMALAGYDAEKSMATLPSVLNLAASGGMDLARASDVITDAETALGLKAGEVETLVAQMAKTASTTNTSVEQLGDALLTVGGTAQFMSGGITEINSVLGVLANSGIKGSEAGTKLRNMILSLSAPTDKGTKALADMGVSIFNAEGNMRSFTEIFPDLQNALGKLTDEQQIKALSEIFNARDVAAATALMHTNAEEWEAVGTAIRQSQGAAEEMANTQLDNLSGQMTLFRSALEGAKIAISDRLTPTLRDFMGLATDGLSKVTGAFQEGGLTAAMEQFGTFLSQVIDKVIEALPTIVEAGTRLIGALVQGIFDNSDKIFDAAEKIITMLVEYLVNNAESIVGGVVQLVSKLVSRLPSLIMPIVRALPNLIKSIVRGIVNNLPILVQGVVDLVNGIVTELPLIITELISAIPDVLRTVLNPANLSKILSVLLNGAVQLALGLIDNLPKIVEMLVESLPEIIDMLFDSIVVLVPRMVAGAIKAVTEYVRHLPEIIKGLIEAIPQILSSILSAFGPIGEMLGGLFSGVMTNIGGILGGLVDVAGSVLGEVGNVAEGVFNWIGTLMDNPAQAIKDAFEGIKDYASKVFDSVKTIVTGIFDLIEAKRAEAEAKARYEEVKSKADELRRQGLIVDLKSGSSMSFASKEAADAWKAGHQGEYVNSVSFSQYVDTVKQKIEVGGKLTVEGVNNQGEFVAAADYSMDEFSKQLERDARLYSYGG